MKSSIGVGSAGAVLLVLVGIALVFYFHNEERSKRGTCIVESSGDVGIKKRNCLE
jgi:hypothetical protein